MHALRSSHKPCRPSPQRASPMARPRSQQVLLPQWLILVVAATLLLTFSLPAHAQAALGAGTVRVDEPLIVGANETLVLEAGARLVGNGSVQVAGTLILNGTASTRVTFLVPVVISAGGAIVGHDAVWRAIDGSALTATSATVTLANVTFDGNARGVDLDGSTLAEISHATLREHTHQGVRIANGAALLMTDVTLTGNDVGVQSAGALDMTRASLVANGQHFNISAPAGALASVRFADVEAGPMTRNGAALDLAAPAGARLSARTLRTNVHDAAIGIRAVGAGVTLDGDDDKLVDNAVGVLVRNNASVRLVNATLGNTQNALGPLALINANYVVPGTTPASEVGANTATPPRATVIFVVLALIAAIAVAARFRTTHPGRGPAADHTADHTAGNTAGNTAGRPASPQPSAARLTHNEQAPSESAARAHGAPDIAARLEALGDTAHRILAHIVANPGATQRDIADRLELTRQNLHYHIRRLEADELVERRRDGRTMHCFARDEVIVAIGTHTRSDERTQDPL